MAGLGRGLALDTLLSAQCASTIDYLATYYFQNRSKDRPPVHALHGHLQAQPDMIFTLLSTLFNKLLFGSVNHWAITRPILSLMLASEEVSEPPLPPSLLPVTKPATRGRG